MVPPSGVPTVAFDYGAAREYLRDGIHGAAIRDGDDAGFVNAVANIGNDHVLREAMRMAARQAVSALRPEQVASDFDDVLRGLSEARRQDASVATA